MADVPPVVEPLEDGDPAQVGPYRIAGRLGVGGMGTVYYALAADGRAVAVKVIRREFAREPEFRTRFLREAHAAQRVARFCTAEVLDVATDRPEPYLVTEFIDGPTLADHVRRTGPLPPAELDRLGVAVASALTAVHGANLVHRDLKPGNILLSSSGARVIDFGIARALEATTTLTQRGVLGTPAYMAPEQALGEALTPAADVYAWGGVMLFAATGRSPHGEAVTPVLLYRIVHERPDTSDLPPSLRAIVEWTMQRDPTLRPTATTLLLRLTGATPPPPALTPSIAPPAPLPGRTVIAPQSSPATLPPSTPSGTPPPAAPPRWMAPPPSSAPPSSDPPATPAPATWAGAPTPTPPSVTAHHPNAVQPSAAGQARRRVPAPVTVVVAAVGALVALVVVVVVVLDPGGGGGGSATAGGPSGGGGTTAVVTATTGAGASITLADYTGRASTTAAALLRRAGLVVDTVTVASGPSQRGRVLSTTPAAGASVARGSRVQLRVGDGAHAEARGWHVFKRYDDTSSINESPIVVVSPAGAERQVGTGDKPALAPDASRVVFTGTDGEIVSVRPDGTDAHPVTDEPDGSSDSAVFSPDGRTLAYARNIGGVYLVDAGGGNRRRISAVRGAYELSWAPDGNRLVYRNGNDQSLHLLSLDGADRVLTGPPVPGAAAVEPAFSPDGREIVFSSSAGGVHVISVDGGAARQIAGTGTWHPGWSPQGAIVYVQDATVRQFFAASGPLRVVNPDGTGDRLLSQHTASGPVRWATPKD
ncbi:Serine/threonine protein kinase [Frankia canadensis]|uniref:non-specific serine/threonine protein kinase n=1 Tax=Frankia canadensis TaxID=1836972 RepID=A0A2I2L1V9_9ACTN|nr:protein kinase [Frankia canadensis]SNQ51904.1 Serine/threonine protein kinase [Frankia canadensis]SOU59194.1 Serine/threonine protein kinase [Frankia canadensis]